MRQRVVIAMALVAVPGFCWRRRADNSPDATIQADPAPTSHNRREPQKGTWPVLLITRGLLGVVAETAGYVGGGVAGILGKSACGRPFWQSPCIPTRARMMAQRAPGRASFRAPNVCQIPGTVPKLGEMPPGCPWPRCPDAILLPNSWRRIAWKTITHAACWLFTAVARQRLRRVK